MVLALADHPELPARALPVLLSLPVPPASQLLPYPTMTDADDTSADAVSGSPCHHTPRLVHAHYVTAEHMLPAPSWTEVPSVACPGPDTALLWVQIQRGWHSFLFWEEEKGVTLTDPGDPGLLSRLCPRTSTFPGSLDQVTPERKLRGYVGLAHTKGTARRLQRPGSLTYTVSPPRSTTKLSTALHLGPTWP